MKDLKPAVRRFLKQQAHHLKPVVQVGKGGLGEGLVKQLDVQLTAHELLKVKLNQNADYDQAELDAAIENVGAVLVQKVGSVLTLFRQNQENSNFVIPK